MNDMERDDDQDISSLVRRHATRHAAGDDLRAAVRTQITLADAGRAQRTGSRRTLLEAVRRAWQSRGWRGPAAGFALGVVLTVAIFPGLERIEFTHALDRELVADHVRALREGPLTEVASSDRHTVKPWFQGRLDYAPPVFDLAADGFPLLGGRVERVRGTATAALAFVRNRHVIDLFVWPAGDRAELQVETHRGFNVVRWSDGAMQYRAVSDLGRQELERFARAYQEQSRRQ